MLPDDEVRRSPPTAVRGISDQGMFTRTGGGIVCDTGGREGCSRGFTCSPVTRKVSRRDRRQIFVLWCIDAWCCTDACVMPVPGGWCSDCCEVPPTPRTPDAFDVNDVLCGHHHARAARVWMHAFRRSG
jgi:hypothetical protein